MWTYLVQRSSQIIAIKNIEIKDTWFTPDLEVYNRKSPINELRSSPENTNNRITLLQSVPNVQESPTSEGASVSEVM